MSDFRMETKCVQSGYEPGNGEARVLPIYQSTTFRYTSSEQMGRLFDLEEAGYFYTRLQNPTNDAVAAKICDLEGGAAAMLTSSGQAANFYAIMNIVFDIGNVLAGFAWQEFYLSFGFSEDIYEKLTKATIKSAFWNELDRGVLNDDELLEGFIRNDPSIEKEIREVFQSVEKMITRYDYAIPWVKELKDRGYGIYVISNFSHKAYIECADALDFLKETDGAILSFQEKLIKPMPEIYQLLTKRYGLKAQECVFIDDTAKNVDAAVKEGMKGIVFHTLEQVKTELEEMLTF